MRNKQAFTLVELIVVITIGAILLLIGFMSFTTYISNSRDTTRVSQLRVMSEALEVYATNKELPKPATESTVEVRIGSRVIWYQWVMGERELKKIGYTEWGVDPKDQKHFWYYITKDKKYFQLLYFLENENEDLHSFQSNTTYAGEYSNRIPKVTGRKLGILLNDENTPIHMLPTITASGYLDIGDVGNTTVYSAIISDDEVITGTGYTLLESAPDASCRRLRQVRGSREDWFYQVDPYGDGVGYSAYCAFDYKNITFESIIENGDIENVKSLNWVNFYYHVKWIYEWTYSVRATDDTHSGDYSIKTVWRVNPFSRHFTYVKMDKKYRFEWWFKSVGTIQSKLHYWFREYDEQFRPINTVNVKDIAGTSTKLLQAVNNWDTQVVFDGSGGVCDKWKHWNGNSVYFSNHLAIAFDIDDSWEYNDLPNYNISQHWFASVVEDGTKCTVTLNFNQKIWKTYPIGTKIRLHVAGSTYNYAAASWDIVPNTWTKYSSEISGESVHWNDYSQFRRGTKFIKVSVLASRKQTTDSSLYIDDMKMVEY